MDIDLPPGDCARAPGWPTIGCTGEAALDKKIYKHTVYFMYKQHLSFSSDSQNNTTTVVR